MLKITQLIMQAATSIIPLKLTFLGAGWVGGLSSSVLAQNWPEHSFYVYDISAEQIEKWNTNNLPFFEEGLMDIVKAQRGVNLHFTNKKEEAFEGTDFFFICVNTPTKTKGLGAGEVHDLKYVEACVRDIALYYSLQEMTKPIAIVEKSTVGTGTANTLASIFKGQQVNFKGNKDQLCIISNPEFLAEGVAVNDLKFPDRVIIGSHSDALSDKMASKLQDLYARFVHKEKIIRTGTFTSELSKIVSNAFLAQRISSINSLSPICEKLSIDISDLSKCVGADTRIGSKYLNASVGFGGSCLEKDLLALVYLARSLGLEEVAEYWRVVFNMNNYQKRRLSNLIVQTLGMTLVGKRICLLGVAFKKGTNDCRGGAPLTLAKHLLEEGAIIQVYDPQTDRSHFLAELAIYTGMNLTPAESESRVVFSRSAGEAAKEAEAIVVLTEWDEFRKMDYSPLYSSMKKPAYLFDFRKVVDIQLLHSLGFEVFSLGSGRQHYPEDGNHFNPNSN